MGLPLSFGADQLTVAWPSPAIAVTLPGASGALGAPAVAALKVTVAASQIVFAPVVVPGLGVAPAPPSTRSWASSSMSPAGDTFVRTVYAGSPASVFEKPESA